MLTFGWFGIGTVGAFGGGPRGATKNGNCNTLLSGRAARAKNGNGNTLLSTGRAAKDQRTATATPFCPRRAAKGHEEWQRQHLFVHEGPRRATKNGNGNTFLSTKGREGATKGREERQRQHPFVHEGPLRATKNGTNTRRTATATHLFVHEGPLRPPFRLMGHEERQRQHPFVHEGPLRASAKNGAGGRGFGGGRCGGCPPAQGRAVGPTVKKGRSPWGRRGFAEALTRLFAGQGRPAPRRFDTK